MGNDQKKDLKRKFGVNNVEYFSGAQVSLFIGDIWVDEITSISWQGQQSKTPIYGYASELYDAVLAGNFLVQGQFSINFKEAGYLWLVLDRFKKRIGQGKGVLNPFEDKRDEITGEQTTDEKEYINRLNIETIINNAVNPTTKDPPKISKADEIALLDGIGETYAKGVDALTNFQRKETERLVRGYASTERLEGGIGAAENAFEKFENAIWRKNQRDLDSMTRRADDNRLNPFDIYITYGDYTGNDKLNHTVIKLSDVNILGKSQVIHPDGQPLQEVYSFIARNIV